MLDKWALCLVSLLYMVFASCSRKSIPHHCVYVFLANWCINWIVMIDLWVFYNWLIAYFVVCNIFLFSFWSSDGYALGEPLELDTSECPSLHVRLCILYHTWYFHLPFGCTVAVILGCLFSFARIWIPTTFLISAL